jgi:glutamate-ammonia-ligase adenylyltransferase
MTQPISLSLRQAIEQLPEPLQATASRAWERICENNDIGNGKSGWTASQSAVVARMLACSTYAAGAIRRQWRWFCDAIEAGHFQKAPQTGFALPAGKHDETAARQLLRRYRHRQLLHILWREFEQCASLNETLTSLSVLADELLIAARNEAEASLRDRFGLPVGSSGQPIPLLILAMGKLGGYELNFSSDIDIVFLYQEEGESNGPRTLSAQEYFTRLVRRTVSLLDDVTEDGFVYRVDTRLRPFGDSGPPVVSFSSLESYLLQHGRSWERYAYVKARVVDKANISDAAAELKHNVIEPFVYRRYLDYGVFESLRDMQALIAAEVEKRELVANIKLGPGGIREIEFIVQSLQLVRGGGNIKLRCRELGVALQELDRSRALSANCVIELNAAYRFLRRLENMIQAIRDQQTHDVPEDSLDRERLTLAMQFDSWESLATELAAHRANVSRRFREVAFRAAEGAEDKESSRPDKRIGALWDARADEEQWSELLDEEGFAEAQKIAAELAFFAGSAQVRNISKSAQKRLREFIQVLLLQLRERQSADVVLRRVLNITGKILRRSAYIALLNENHGALRRLVNLCEQSAYLADEIGRFPLLLDEMLDSRLFTSVVSGHDLRADIEGRLLRVADSESESKIEVLAQFQRASLFRIAVVDFSGALPIMKVSDALTELAELVLARALDVAWQDLVQKHGEPWFVVDGESRRAGFGVIAYGKLGGMELSYGSDLDLVFLHDSAGSQQQTDGDHPLENSMFFARLVRRLVHFLTTQTSSGVLYEVDTRLRPSGRSGLMVSSVEGFERYQLENAWTWEHQALLRSRPVAGSVSVCREFERVRAGILTGRIDQEALVEDVRSMRARMRGQLDKSTDALFDLKQGLGGIADLEFLVQYLVLRNASGNRAVIHYRDNIRQLGTLAAAACLPSAEVSQLQDIYRSYRTRLHKLALDAKPPLIADGDFAGQRRFVAGLWQREIEDPATDI